MAYAEAIGGCLVDVLCALLQAAPAATLSAAVGRGLVATAAESAARVVHVETGDVGDTGG